MSYQCLIIYRRGRKIISYGPDGYSLLSEDQYKYVTNPPYKLSATVLLVYEDILEQIANSEGERDDLIQQYLRIYRDDMNSYGEKVYYKGAEFFVLQLS
ncbi:uncharacterized protein OCT59_026492 [Rhizophagus irregularis]|uniref:Uncharacterized protein n=1 Tax=Rhizophagus irregularis (strain DAOM 197198w) TaxID=1432141 RepID=A0A015K5G2_RHIIW|nr:hypothetical protein RirG_232840 [Rhizophagus irregularis DAOM 197198w]UZO06161.1 hypothetical protein OCT59_026492 [Rhizophagus irregularis]GBC16786.1 hypothetical protein GLOIN_2v1448918 [Rhizophagus irregularis DAOM 181602=DAOM 197198]